MSQTFKGHSCKNARIKVDYSGKKPDVTFSYPSNKYGTEAGMGFYIFTGWFIIWIIGFWAIGLDHSVNQVWEPTSLEKFTECRLKYPTVEFDNIIKDYCKDILQSGIKWRASLLLVISIFAPPMLIYLPFKRKWKDVYPKFQGWLAKKKVMKFKSKDIRYDVQLGYFCEVPVFSNIILNYTATKDFSKQLNFLEIEEFKFKYWVHKHKGRKAMSKKHKGMHKQRALNEWIWYARFYFKDKPKTGSLEVIFK
jgi:hypothetical protein